jgi:hypothetical protein
MLIPTATGIDQKRTTFQARTISATQEPISQKYVARGDGALMGLPYPVRVRSTHVAFGPSSCGYRSAAARSGACGTGPGPTRLGRPDRGGYMEVVGDTDAPSDRVWADRTRRVLTRDLLLRASRSSSGEARALEFRALHLNLSLIGELTDAVHLTEAERLRAEHDGLEGLLDAVRRFDPFGDREFVEVAIPLIERRIRDAADARTRPARRPVRLVVDRAALAIVGPPA